MTDYSKKLEPGDRLLFEKITVEARKMSKVEEIQMSSSHRGIRVKFSKSGIIHVDKTWKYTGSE